MTRLAEVEAHLTTMGELLDIVGAMRSLASMRVQEAHRALPDIRRYAETMRRRAGARTGSAGGLGPSDGDSPRRRARDDPAFDGGALWPDRPRGPSQS